MTHETLEHFYGSQYQTLGVNLGSPNSSTPPTVSKRAPDVAFPRLTEDTAQNAGLSLVAPELSIGEIWDGRLETLEKKARAYNGPDLPMEDWLTEAFGRGVREGDNSLQGASRLVNGKINLRYLLNMAREWDEEGLSQPEEFAFAVRCETEGTRQEQAVRQAALYASGGPKK